MKNIIILAAIVISHSFIFSAHAQTLRFDQVTQADLDSIAKEFSANFVHSTVSGAAPLGDVFGFQIGMVGGMTLTPEIDRFIKQVDGTQSNPQLYNAFLSGQLSVPYGVTGEISYFPAVGTSTYKFSNLALGIKWTFSDFLGELPVDIAVRMNYTSTDLSFKQIISNASTGNVPVDSTINYKNTTMGYGLFVSRDFIFAEPYLGVSYLNSQGDISVSGTGTIFNSTFTQGQSASSSPKTTAVIVGSEFFLGIVSIGLEYARLFDTSRYLGKIAVTF